MGVGVYTHMNRNCKDADGQEIESYGQDYVFPIRPHVGVEMCPSVPVPNCPRLPAPHTHKMLSAVTTIVD